MPQQLMGAKRTLFLLLLFHVIFIGARIRLGAFPLELYFFSALFVVPYCLRTLGGGLRFDTVQVIVLMLVLFQIVMFIIEISSGVKDIDERLYFEANRLIPLLVFFWLYSNRHVLSAAGSAKLISACILFAFILHASSTFIAATSDEGFEAVTKIANIIDSPSARSLGVTSSIYDVDESGQYVVRSAGLSKTAPQNAGILAFLGSMLLLAAFRTGRWQYALGAVLALGMTILTLSRGAFLSMSLALALAMFLGFRINSTFRPGQLLLVLGLTVAAIILFMQLYSGGLFATVATERFGQILGTGNFESASLKWNSTLRFFDIVFKENYGIFYGGEGLNNFALRTRGLYDFDAYEVGFVSNSLLLFVFDGGFVYGILIATLFIILLRRIWFIMSEGLVVLLPLFLAAASDNFYAVVFEMHALFWLSLGLICVLLGEREATAASRTSSYQKSLAA
jgi:hypothetical protein